MQADSENFPGEIYSYLVSQWKVYNIVQVKKIPVELTGPTFRINLTPSSRIVLQE